MLGEVLSAVRSGNWRSLFASFIYFDHSFSVWLVIGALGPFIAEYYGLSGAQKGFMVAVPIIAAAVFRLSFGYMFQYLNGRWVAVLGILLSLIPHAYMVLKGFEVSYRDLLWMGVLLGVAGASFAVALPMAGSCYPKEVQGLVLGLVAAGNIGAVIDGMIFPPIARTLGWKVAFALSGVLLLVALIFILLWAEDRTRKEDGPKVYPVITFLLTVLFMVALVLILPPDLKLLMPVLGILLSFILMPASFKRAFLERDTWTLMTVYSVTFGGFVGMSSYVAMLLRDIYGVSKIEAGLLMSLFAFTGAMIRPLGGYIADRVGGATALIYILGGIACVNILMGFLTPPFFAGVLLILLLYIFYGLGNGATFQLVPHRWPYRTGLMTGIIGAAGGIGGFYLPTINGMVYEVTGSYGPAFLIFGGVSLVAGLLVKLSHSTWMEWAYVRYDHQKERLVGIDPKTGRVVMEVAG